GASWRASALGGARAVSGAGRRPGARRGASSKSVAWGLSLALGISWGAANLSASPLPPAPVDSATWVEHDGRPIPRPAKHEENFYSYIVRTAVVEPVAHFFDVPDKIFCLAERVGVRSKPQAADVNAFDEVPNSTWFTNRNHVRAVPLIVVRQGAHGDVRPRAPYLLKAPKSGGTTFGFQVVDAGGKRWLFKL